MEFLFVGEREWFMGFVRVRLDWLVEYMLRYP